MDSNPYEKPSYLGLIVPIAAIVAAIGIGLYVKQSDPGSKPPRPPAPGVATKAAFVPPVVKVEKTTTGLGPPVKADGNLVRNMSEAPPSFCAAWARFDVPDAKTFDDAGLAFACDCQDASGKRWPSIFVRIGNSFFVIVVKGYDQAPSRLVCTLSDSRGRFVGKVDLPRLPEPSFAPAPPLTPAWKGLSAVGWKTSQATGTVAIKIDGPVGAGHILAARFLGSSNYDAPGVAVNAIKGPNEGLFTQRLPLTLKYPKATKAAYLEVSEMAPFPAHTRLGMSGLEVIEQFGSAWLKGVAPSVEFSDGVYIGLLGRDQKLFRPPQHPRVEVPAYLAVGGRVSEMKVSLVSPKTMLGLPVVIRRMDGGPSSNDRATGAWTSGPLKIVVDIDGLIYRPIRKATIAVDVHDCPLLPYDPSDPTTDLNTPRASLELVPAKQAPYLLHWVKPEK